MAKVVVTLKIMPENVKSNLDSVEIKIKEILKEERSIQSGKGAYCFWLKFFEIHVCLG